jgi:outer membrane protein assembly factor BamB
VRGRSGTIVVAIVMSLGLTLGGIGAWWVVHARPRPGEFIDALATPDGAVVVRKERSSDRAFLEVYDGTHLRWRGMVPRYAGHPGVIAVAASPRSITVRVVRGGHPFVFAFDAATGAKLDLFDLTPGTSPDPSGHTMPTVATVGDGHHSVELVTAAGGGSEIFGLDLEQRRLMWRRPLADRPEGAAWVGDLIVLRYGGGGRARALRRGDGSDAPVPPDAGRDVAPHTTAGGRTWRVTPREITVMDAASGQVLGTIR